MHYIEICAVLQGILVGGAMYFVLFAVGFVKPAVHLLRHGASPQKATLVGADCTLFAMAPSASPHPHCSPVPSRLLSAKGHACFGYALLDAGVAPLASLPTFCGKTRVHGLRERHGMTAPLSSRGKAFGSRVQAGDSSLLRCVRMTTGNGGRILSTPTE